MAAENRQVTRYKEIGQVVCPLLCAISGILDDISLTGCKIHFPCPVVVDLENEYELELSVSHSSEEEPLHLLCQPQWCNETSGTTQIGLKVLFSPDANRLKELISYLESETEDDILLEIKTDN